MYILAIPYQIYRQYVCNGDLHGAQLPNLIPTNISGCTVIVIIANFVITASLDTIMCMYEILLGFVDFTIV